MALNIILFLILLFLVLIIFKIYNKDVFEPSFLFSISFLILSLMALLNNNKWNLNLHLNTFLVVVLGVIEFVLVCFIVKTIYQKKFLKEEKYGAPKLIKIPYYFEIPYFFLSIIICIVFALYIISVVNVDIKSIKDISNAIGIFDYLSKFTENYDTVKLPFLVSNSRFAIIAIGSIFNYVIINNYFVNKKFKLIEIGISLVALISTFLDGSRTGAFYYVFAIIAMIFILRNKKNNYKNNFNFIIFKNIFIISAIFILSFLPLAKLLGRNTNNINTFDYISIYCGAQLKNLDIALQEDDFPKKSSIFGSQTFYTLNKTLGTKFNLKNYGPYHVDTPFRRINGYNLGNVYTTFYAYIYDFGYFGEFVLVFVMAFISQLIYEKTKESKKNRISLSILMYSFISNMLIMSFFSNKFYENIFSTIFIKNILIWIVCIALIESFNNERSIKNEKE